MAKINGTKENDLLNGTLQDDIIRGLSGNDDLSGDLGDDLLLGGSGDDKLSGDAGDDTINGGDGDDNIFVGDGTDSVFAGSGDDKVAIFGSGSADVSTGAGADSIRLRAGALGSSITQGKGADSVSIAVSTQSNQVFNIDGGKGINTVDFDGALSLYTVTRDAEGVHTVVDANGNTYIIENADGLVFAGVPYIEPNNPNNVAPIVANPISDQAATEDTPFSFQFSTTTFTDADGDALTYTASFNGGALPAWLSFDAATRTFSGTPTNANVGSVTVNVTASDGQLTAIETFVITVGNVNDAPIGSPTAALAAGSEDLAYIVSAASLLAGFSDPDGDALSVTGLSASSGATVTDNGNGTWTILPATNFNGTVSLGYSVTDGRGGTLAASQGVVFNPVNDAPTLNVALADQSAEEGAAFSFTFPAATFGDVDNAVLTYSAQLQSGASLPGWLLFDAATRTFSGTPDGVSSGTYSIRVTASDGSLNTSDIFVLTVDDVPRPGVVSRVLELTEDFDYDVSENQTSGLITVVADGRTFTFNSADIDSVLTAGSDSVDIDSRGWRPRDIAGDVNFTNVTFVQANVAGDSKFEASFDLGNVNLTGDVTVNGNIEDYFRTAWDYLDDHYSYYDEEINAFGVELGIQYALYLKAGGPPLTDIVKYSADSNGNGIPQRLQLLHDNLLGNLDEASIADKFSEGTAGDVSDVFTPDEILDLITSAGLGDYIGTRGLFTDGRGIFTGNENDIDSAAHNRVRVFDYEHGFARSDYVSFDDNGRVDAVAINGAEMYYGSGNSPNNFVIEQHEGAGVETALKIHYRHGNDVLPFSTAGDGAVVFHVREGAQTLGLGGSDRTDSSRSAWSFDYSLATGLNGAEGDIDDFDFVFKVDMDSTAGVNYMVFKLEGSNGVTPFVARDGGGASVGAFNADDGTGIDFAQNSANFGFTFLKDAVDGGTGYNYGDGTFDFELIAYEKGTTNVLSDVHIRVIVDDGFFIP